MIKNYRFDLVNAHGDQIGAFTWIGKIDDHFEAIVQPTEGGIAYGREISIRFDFREGAEAYVEKQVEKIKARFKRISSQ